ncbi:MFS transporter [Corynebacterium crudilactis]|uniref:Major facilitator superfamily (MFS) profile domain-containing protein n=1 Tax=Corynebacterium crudilactis TaxID=1652495 RepID=A0A172QTA7_9CORY|nr:hypothetical protein ccrud_06400 [Corynebacterium crudilactis]
MWVKKAAKSGFWGGLAEYYDFGLYGTASAVIFPTVFFGGAENAYLANIASLASFGVAYLARPLGAIVLGRLGDSWGRKNTLFLTLGLMGFATLVIGFLPSYAQIGPAAGIILVIMRLIQGFSAGGEQAGSNTLTSEWAPPEKRGFYTAFTMHGLALGQLLALGAFIPFSGSDSFLFSWGWRIPYFIAIPVILYAIYVRTKVTEPPRRVVPEAEQTAHKAGLSTLFRFHWKNVLRIIFMGQFAITGVLLTNYSLNYGVTAWNMEKSQLLTLATVSMVVGLLVQPLWASLSDKIGRRPVYITSMVGLVLLFPILFYSLTTGNVFFMAVVYVLLGLISTGGNVVQAPMYTEMFPTEVRMTGYALSTQLANIVVGFTPMIAAMLVKPGELGWVPVLVFTSIMMGLGILSCISNKETKGSVIV